MNDSLQETEPATLVYGKYRLEALADGIFAFAMTLLVINFHIPSLYSVHTESQLLRALTDQSSMLFSYALSFILLGIAWTGHQAQFARVIQTNHVQNWLHIMYLMTIAAVPFSTGLLGQFGAYRTAHVIYGLNLLLGSTIILLLWWHADRKHIIVMHEETKTFISSRYRRLFMTLVLYASAVALSFVDTDLSYAIYLTMVVLLIVPHKILDGFLVRLGI